MRRTLSTPIPVLAAFVFVLTEVGAALAQAAGAQPTPQGLGGLPQAQADKLFYELISLMIVATILEAALAVIFQWRVYRTIFNARATKTLVTVAVAALVVSVFHYPIFDRIMTFAGVPAEKLSNGPLSIFLSALVLAGGSAGVHSLLRSFGFRTAAVEVPAPKPPPNEAWISVQIAGGAELGQVALDIEELAADAAGNPPLVGIFDDRGALKRIADMIFSSPRRIPPSGGRTLTPGCNYRLRVHTLAVDAAGRPMREQEVFKGSLAPQALVDFRVDWTTPAG